MKFSDWTKRADSHIIDTACGDSYEELSDNAKKLIDGAIERFIQFRQNAVMLSLPSDGKMDIIKAKNEIAKHYGFDSWVDLYRTITDRGEGLYYEVEAYRLLLNNLERGNGA